MTETNRNKILDIISQEIEELKIAAIHVEFASYIAYSRGVALDEIGVLLGVPRPYGQLDTQYRGTLLNVLKLRIGGGTKASLIDYLENYLEIDTADFKVYEPSPGYVQLELHTDYEAQESIIEELLSNAIAAGVYFDLVYDAAIWDTAKWDIDKWR